jgi:hypothetical protein
VIKAPENGMSLARIELGLDGRRTFAVDRVQPDPSGHNGVPIWLDEVIDSYRAWADTPIDWAAGAPWNRNEVAWEIARQCARVCASDLFLLNLGAIRAGVPAEVDRAALVDTVPFESDLVVASEINRRDQLGDLPAARPRAARPGGTGRDEPAQRGDHRNPALSGQPSPITDHRHGRSRRIPRCARRDRPKC